jgi:hypothetical protein
LRRQKEGGANERATDECHRAHTLSIKQAGNSANPKQESVRAASLIKCRGARSFARTAADIERHKSGDIKVLIAVVLGKKSNGELEMKLARTHTHTHTAS